MKIFFTYSHEKFLNSYLVVNEKLKEALLIDPLKLGMETISIIERHKLNLTYILFTHGDKALQKEGILTTAKVYTHVSVIRSDYQLSAENSELYEKTNFQLLNSGDGKITLAGFDVEYFAVSGLTPGAHLFKIENAVNEISNTDSNNINVVLPNQEQMKTDTIKNTTSIDIETL